MSNLPVELLSTICSFIYSSSLPNVQPSLDPCFVSGGAPLATPSTYPPDVLPEPMTRKTLANLCLVSRTWSIAARPYLWRNVEVRLPRTWIAFLEQVLDSDVEIVDGPPSPINAPLSAITEVDEPAHDPELLRSPARLCSVPYDSIPLELLSPLASREPSPSRLRLESPTRWRLARAVSAALAAAESGQYVPSSDDPRPGRLVQHLDFNHFRTIGMRRSVEEGVRSRFVTASRLVRVLKEMPRLAQFGATEYMDGALNKAVLVELLLRGRALAFQNQSTRGRGITHQETQLLASRADDVERLREVKGLEALDLCGCISSVFVQGLEEFVKEYLQDEVDEDGTRVPSQVTIPSLKRLGLRGVTSIPSSILMSFVTACTSLTHLDLSGTRCTPDLLTALGNSTSVRLESLALARCSRLTSGSVADFLIEGLSARTITQLSLYGDSTFPTPITGDDLMRIVIEAPCFRSGLLEYLDLSSCPVEASTLRAFRPQPALRSLGLSYIPSLSLRDISAFISSLAANTEILTLNGTSPELSNAAAPRSWPMSMHSLIIGPLATSPFHFSLSGLSTPNPPPTRLRVIELSTPVLNSLGGGGDSWKTVKSKGGRAWYVHLASGWVNGELRRNLEPGHPLRVEMERLAASNGNVNSGVGWHARKMEVLHGHGMLGREDGLYGAVSFAYQG